MISEDATGQSGQSEGLRVAKALSLKEVCQGLGCGLTFLYDKINRGELEARKVGRRTVILPEEFARFRNSLPVVSPKQRQTQPTA